MAPTIRFLQQLAPSVRRDGALVRAALPSRFAPQGAEVESSVNSLGVELEATTTSRAEVKAAPQVATVVAERDVRPVMRDVPRATDDASVAPRPKPFEREAQPRRPVPEQIVSTERGPTEALAPVIASRRLPNAEVPTRPSAAANDETRTNRDTAPIIRRAAPQSDAARPPLREHVREQRIGAAAAPQPTIVQVTIDRIDVRAATTNASPERATPKARAASWKSLGDYLKQGDRGGGGAA